MKEDSNLRRLILADIKKWSAANNGFKGDWIPWRGFRFCELDNIRPQDVDFEELDDEKLLYCYFKLVRIMSAPIG